MAKQQYNNAANSGNGPLASLYGRGNSLTDLRYPRNIGNFDRPHAIKFYINLPQNSYYTNLPSTGVTPGQTVGDFFGTIPGLESVNNINFTPNTKRLSTTITLYMPDTVSTSYNASYQEDNMSDYAIPFYGQLGKDALSTLGSVFDESSTQSFISDLSRDALALINRRSSSKILPADAFLRAQGIAINPQVQLLFRAVALREFQFEFMFSPKTSQESEQVREIINTFRFHSAPEVGGGTNPDPAGNPTTDKRTNLFYVVPSTFNIDLLFNGETNKYLNKIGECVLETVAVDYAPNGFSTFEDGSPVQIRMTLQFKEVDVVDKNSVSLGY